MSQILNLTCPICGTNFQRYKSQIKRTKAVPTCSNRCRAISVLGVVTHSRDGETFEEMCEKFWAKVDKTPGLGPNGDCWEWRGSIHYKGYGETRAFRDKMKAHRASWYAHTGTNPGKMHVCHKCDHRLCVRPDHLWLGTNKDNSDDKIRKGRQARGSASGNAKLNENLVYWMRFVWDRGCTHLELSKRLGVSESAVLTTINNTWWKHIKKDYYEKDSIVSFPDVFGTGLHDIVLIEE